MTALYVLDNGCSEYLKAENPTPEKQYVVIVRCPKHSPFDGADFVPAAGANMSRIFTIKGSVFKYHLDITATADTTDHGVHVRRRALTGNTPLLTMHDGSDEDAPVLAVSHLPHFSQNFKIGLGDAKGPPDGMRWEDLTTEKSGVKHRWAMNFGDEIAEAGTGAGAGEETGKHERKTLLWTRTKHVTVDGMHKPAFSAQNYKLTEEHDLENAPTGDGKDKDIVAVFTSTRAKGEIGRIQLNVNHGRDFDIMVWMTCMTIYWAGR